MEMNNIDFLRDTRSRCLRGLLPGTPSACWACIRSVGFGQNTCCASHHLGANRGFAESLVPTHPLTDRPTQRFLEALRMFDT